MNMCFKVRSFLLAVLLFLPLVFLLGCTSSMEQDFEEGRIYVVNNARPVGGDWGFNIMQVWVIWEDVRYDTPFNMTVEKDPTGAGVVELTDSPLPGGMVAEVTYYYIARNVMEQGNVTITVDGNVTIDLYMKGWDNQYSTVTARVVPGRWDGVHFY